MRDSASSPCHDADAARDNTLLRAAGALALGTLLVMAWRACHGTHRRRRASRPAGAPAAEHTWEGEGGRPLD